MTFLDSKIIVAFRHLEETSAMTRAVNCDFKSITCLYTDGDIKSELGSDRFDTVWIYLGVIASAYTSHVHSGVDIQYIMRSSTAELLLEKSYLPRRG